MTLFFVQVLSYYGLQTTIECLALDIPLHTRKKQRVMSATRSSICLGCSALSSSRGNREEAAVTILDSSCNFRGSMASFVASPASVSHQRFVVLQGIVGRFVATPVHYRHVNVIFCFDSEVLLQYDVERKMYLFPSPFECQPKHRCLSPLWSLPS